MSARIIEKGIKPIQENEKKQQKTRRRERMKLIKHTYSHNVLVAESCLRVAGYGIKPR